MRSRVLEEHHPGLSSGKEVVKLTANRKGIGLFVLGVLLALAFTLAMPAFAHHQPEFGKLRRKVKKQHSRIVRLESYVLDLNGRICALEDQPGGPGPGQGCPG